MNRLSSPFNTATAPALPADVRLMNATTALLVALGLVGLVVGLLMLVAQHRWFSIERIRVDGELAHNTALTLRTNVASRLKGNFFTIDLEASRLAFEAVPWVRQAVVKRAWPNQLAVVLQEHRAVALWSSDAGVTDKLVNSFGEVFEANLGDVEEDKLPTLTGPEGASAVMLAMLQRLQPVFASMGTRMQTLELSGRGSWRTELDSGADIQLGRGTDGEVLERTQRFASTFSQVSQRFERPLQYADLRHREGYAVRMKGVSTVTDAVTPEKK
jgi:cell division protein FtsQ